MTYCIVCIFAQGMLLLCKTELIADVTLFWLVEAERICSISGSYGTYFFLICLAAGCWMHFMVVMLLCTALDVSDH